MLVLGAVSAFGFGMWKVFGPSSVAAQVREEQANLNQLSTALHQSFGLVGDYQGVTNNRILEDRLVSNNYLRQGTADIRDSWGQSVNVAGHTINEPFDGFSITYPAVPAEACTGLANAVSRSVFDLRVEGQSIMNGAAVDTALAVERCNREDGAEMQFIYYSGLVQDSNIAAVALPPGNPSNRFNPPTQTDDTVNAPDGGAVSNPVVSVPDPATPGGSTGNPGGTGSTPAPNTGTPVTAGPPSSGTPGVVDPTIIGVACSASMQTQTVNCPAGQYGLINQQRTFSCPEAWEAAVAGPWVTTSNTCTACPAPSTENDTPQWVAQSSACPPTQTGLISWEREEIRTRSISYSCPAGTTALPSPTTGAWGSWTATGATRNMINTCATSCVVLPPETQIQTIALPDVVAPCPPSQVGEIRTTQEADQSRTRTYSCPAGTWSPWSAWATTAVRSTGTTNTCSTVCTPEAPQSTTELQWVAAPSSIATCANGFYGPGVTTFLENEQSRTGTRTYSCPAGTWSAWSYSGWSNTGNTRTAGTSGSCTACPSPSTQTEYQTVPRSGTCPVGTTGTVTFDMQQVRTRSLSYNCPAGTSSLPAVTTGVWSAWSDTGVTSNTVTSCAPIAPSSGVWQVIASQAYPDSACDGGSRYYDRWYSPTFTGECTNNGGSGGATCTGDAAPMSYFSPVSFTGTMGDYPLTSKACNVGETATWENCEGLISSSIYQRYDYVCM